MSRKKAIKKAIAEEKERKRCLMFEGYVQENPDDIMSVFSLPGITLHIFRHTKIKFSFRPSQLQLLVSNRVVFYCSLIYRRNNWVVRRDSFPANCKTQIHNLFFTKYGLNDQNIFEAIRKIYTILEDWSKEHHNFRQQRKEVILQKLQLDRQYRRLIN